MRSEVLVADRVAEAIASEGVEVAFGLLGDGNMIIMGAFATLPGRRLVQGRHDGAVISMADGYARASGRVGVASVTYGPGVTQIPTALTVAARHRTPMVIVTGELPASGPWHHQRFDHRTLVEACGAQYLSVRTPSEAVLRTAQAFDLARRARCVVVVGYAEDVMAAPADQALPSRVTTLPHTVSRVPDVRSAVDVVGQARRPVIVVGGAGTEEETIAAVEELSDVLGAPIATSLRALNAFDGHPRAIGLAGGFGAELSSRVLSESDCVISVGARLGWYTTGYGKLFPDARIVRVDTVPAPDGDEIPHSTDVALVGDLAATISELSVGLAERGSPRDPWFTRAEEFHARWPLDDPAPDGLMHPAAFLRRMEAGLPENSYLVSGIGHFWFFPISTLVSARGSRAIFEDDFGAIGLALPLAIGAAIALPDRHVYCIEGDGSLLQNVQELETVARESIPLTLIVLNDGAYGAEVHKLAALGRDPELCTFGYTDFTAVAIAFGLNGICISEPEGADAIVGPTFGQRPATVIDARISPRVMSPVYRRNYFGEPA